MAVAAKTLEYAVELDEGGRLTVPGGGQFVTPEGWSADHLLLAALVRCSIDSFAYHARRAGHTVDGHRLGARHDHEDRRRRPLSLRRDRRATRRAGDAARRAIRTSLIMKAERDCFVGASLTVKPEYEWHVS